MAILRLRWAAAVLPILMLVACGGGSGGNSPAPPPTPTLSISPSTASLRASDTLQFSASVSGTDNKQVTWQVNGVTGGAATTGTINASGLFTAPATIPASNPVTVKAILGADATITSTASLTIRQAAAYKVIGYMPEWQGEVSAIPYTKLTHINYAFLVANADGSIDSTSVTPSRLQSLVSLAHQNGVKVLISLGGGANSALTTAMRSDAARATLLTTCKDFVSQYQLDGFDLDWEGPENASDGDLWSSFMQSMHTAMQAQGKLTTTAIAPWFGEYIPASAFAYADFANVMAYDNEGPQHSSYAFAVDQLAYWHNAPYSIPWNKLVLGVPFYGYTSDGSRSETSAYSYRDICAADSNAQNSDYSTGVNATGVGYNGIPTMQQKADYVKSISAGGIMIWELSMDADGSKSLLSAIDTRLNN